MMEKSESLEKIIHKKGNKMYSEAYEKTKDSQLKKYKSEKYWDTIFYISVWQKLKSNNILLEYYGESAFLHIPGGNATCYNPSGGKFGNYIYTCLLTQKSHFRSYTLKIKSSKHICVFWFENRPLYMKGKEKPGKKRTTPDW